MSAGCSEPEREGLALKTLPSARVRGRRAIEAIPAEQPRWEPLWEEFLVTGVVAPSL